MHSFFSSVFSILSGCNMILRPYIRPNLTRPHDPKRQVWVHLPQRNAFFPSSVRTQPTTTRSTCQGVLVPSNLVHSFLPCAGAMTFFSFSRL